MIDGGQTSKMLPVASVTIGSLQMQMNWDDEHDMDRLDLWGKSVVTTFSSGQNGSTRDFLGEEPLRLLHSQNAICTRVYSSIFCNISRMIDLYSSAASRGGSSQP